MTSAEIEQNLQVLDENCKKLIDLISKCHVKLEQFAQLSKELASSKNNEDGSPSDPVSPTTSLNELAAQRFSPEDIQLKNVIVSNLVSYSYDIAHTVKRIVCIMGHSENTNL